jgi:hypothetical protein
MHLHAQAGHRAFDRQLLAQGDSWFSIGALPPWKADSVLTQLSAERSAVIVNCARPGKVLSKMTESTQEPRFRSLIAGLHARPWHALLLSGVGNDLIAAVGSGPTQPVHKRLLKTPAERGPGPLPAAGYISEPAGRPSSSISTRSSASSSACALPALPPLRPSCCTTMRA